MTDHPPTDGHPPIRQLSAPVLREQLESGTALELIDVRTDQERAIARIEGSRLLEQAFTMRCCSLDRDTPIVFQCHHGIRSQHAALFALRLARELRRTLALPPAS